MHSRWLIRDARFPVRPTKALLNWWHSTRLAATAAKIKRRARTTRPGIGLLIIAACM